MKKQWKNIHDIWLLADEIIGKDFGIGVHFSDVYLCDAATFGVTKRKFRNFEKKYKIPRGYFDENTPIALLAMYILDK